MGASGHGLGVVQGGGGSRSTHVAMPVPWASITRLNSRASTGGLRALVTRMCELFLCSARPEKKGGNLVLPMVVSLHRAPRRDRHRCAP